MAHAVALDQREELLGVEAFHDDGGAAVAQRQVDRRLRRGVVQRRRREVDHARPVVPHRLQGAKERRELIGRGHGQRTQHALGPPRGARGIEHRAAERLVGDRCRRHAGDGALVIEERRILPAGIQHQQQFEARARGKRGERDFAQRARGDEHAREAVVHDERELAGIQVRVDAGVVESRALAGRTGLDVARVVLQEDRVVIEAPQALATKQMREPVGAGLDLAVTQAFA